MGRATNSSATTRATLSNSLPLRIAEIVPDDDREGELDREGHHGQTRGDGERPREHLVDGLTREGRAQVALEDAAEVEEVLDDEGLVQVYCARRASTTCGAACRRRDPGWVSGHGEDHEVDQQRGPEEHGEHLQQTSEDVAEHPLSFRTWETPHRTLRGGQRRRARAVLSHDVMRPGCRPRGVTFPSPPRGQRSEGLLRDLVLERNRVPAELDVVHAVGVAAGDVGVPERDGRQVLEQDLLAFWKSAFCASTSVSAMPVASSWSNWGFE